jgi:choline dehydrogenase-like flavoprotein
MKKFKPSYLPANEFSCTAAEKVVETDEVRNEFKKLQDKIQDVGLPQHGCGMFSAHQMGTCRMGVDPLTSVVDCDGESWDRDNL